MSSTLERARAGIGNTDVQPCRDFDFRRGSSVQTFRVDVYKFSLGEMNHINS